MNENNGSWKWEKGTYLGVLKVVGCDLTWAKDVEVSSRCCGWLSGFWDYGRVVPNIIIEGGK